MEVLKVLPPSKLLHHDHLILSHFRRDLQEPVFLLLLREINDVGPALLVLSLEILEELVEGFVLAGEFLD